MHDTLIGAALDWPRQKADFEPDGSLRDIYVQDASVEDWQAVVTRILGGNYRARLQRGGADVPIPTVFEAVFAGELDGGDRHFMSFTVGDIVLDCHFFSPNEIEFSFAPNDVTAASLRDLLALMIDIGETTKKSVIMTPENGPEFPIFSYDSSEHRLRWIPPHESRR